MHSPILVAGALVVTLGSVDARGYCRTTTVHVPSGYDPSDAGCWKEGTPIAWPAGQRVSYSLVSNASRQIDLADATAIAHQAFAAWNDAPCRSGAPSVQAYDDGPVDATLAATDCGLHPCDASVHDGLHVIVFRDDEWPYNDYTNTVALTTVTYGVDTGTIFDADIEVNTFRNTLTTQEPPPPGTIALRAILTHEAGHFFGLAHAADKSSIMYWLYQSGMIDLTADDVAGVCAIYGQTDSKSGGCAAAPARAGEVGAFAVVAALALALSRRRGRQASTG